MTDSSKFWLGCNAILGLLVLGIIYLSTTYWADHNTKIVQLIKEGTDPIAAMCAMQDDYGRHITCVILATKREVTQ